MTGWRSIGAAAVMAAIASSGARLEAQASRHSEPDFGPLSVQFSVGSTQTGDRNRTRRDVDLAARLWATVTPRWSVRAELGRAAWTFDGSGWMNRPLPARVSLRRVTVGLFETVTTPHFRGYAGGGGGIYRFRSAAGSGEAPRGFGIHGAAGFEVPVDNGRTAITADLQLQAIRGPGRTPGYQTPVQSVILWVAGASIGIRVHF